jgi:transcriptional regulator with XRE-family HTH domain
MNWISAGQLRMARALLEWSQEDLALKTRLSISTVRKMEEGYIPRASTVKEIRNLMEDAGLEFIDNEGIRRRFDVVQYRGEEGSDKFFDDVLHTLEKRGGEFLGFIKSPAMLLHSFDISEKDNLHRLDRLNKAAPIKCIVSEPAKASFSIPEVRFRVLGVPDSCPSFFYAYGNKYAIILPRADKSLSFVVFELSSQALAYQKHFHSLWDQSLPIKGQRTGFTQ